MKQDIWSILQIAPTTSKREIRRAYAAQAQKCHPEEQPEEFAKLQEAYQLALAYQEQSNLESWDEHELAEFEVLEDSQQVDGDEAEEDSSNVLLAALESSYEAEQKRRQSEGALKVLITLFEEPKTAKGNKVWAEFFLSDAFLQEYFEEDFAEALDFYLEHQSIYEYDELPQGFLVEWAISYAMTTEEDGCIYPIGNIPMCKVVAKYWNQQTEMWRLQRGARMLVKVENRVRIQAFSNYIMLRRLEKQGLLTEENEYQWRDMIWQGGHNHLYEVNKTIGEYATSIILLKLFVYWISKEEAPPLLAEKMYRVYNLKGNERSSYYSVYKELKEAILHRFPYIEKDEVQEKIKEWASKLIELSLAFAARVEIQFEPETESETADIEKLFADDVWKLYWNDVFMMHWLACKLSFHNMPYTIAQHLYQTYSLPEGIENRERKELREHSMKAIVNYRKYIDKNAFMFWEYFFQRGFGVCSKEIATIPKEELKAELQCCINGDRLYLPAYMKTMYQIDKERQKEFLGYRADIGAIDAVKYYEFTLPDGDVIRAEYYLHYIAYYRNGTRIYKPCIRYAIFETYEKNITVAEEFFILLALTIITEADSEAARGLILKWLPKTLLVENTFSVIADCIVQNNALDRSTEECAISETESICLMVQRTKQGLKLYEYAECGWILREFREGADWQKLDIETVLKSHMKPVTKMIKAFDMKGLSEEEKAEAVWDGLMLYAKHEKGAGLSAPVVPEEYPMLHKLFEEGGMGWLTDSFVVLYYEIPPDHFIREVLYIMVDDWGCGLAYQETCTLWEEEEIQQIQNKIKRRKKEQFILRGSMIREDYPEQWFLRIEPILFGKSGKAYGRYGMSKVCEAESAFELLSQMLQLEYAVRYEVYEGKMTVSAQSSQLEYCFTKEEYQEAYENYKNNMDKEECYKNRCETLVEYYCVMK